MVYINRKERSMLPACPSLLCCFNRGSIVYVCLVLCLCRDWMSNTSKLDKGFIYKQSFEMCSWRSLIFLRWPCAVDRTLKSSHLLTNHTSVLFPMCCTHRLWYRVRKYVTRGPRPKKPHVGVRPAVTPDGVFDSWVPLTVADVRL